VPRHAVRHAAADAVLDDHDDTSADRRADSKPATITVSVGTRVTWTNRQLDVQHTVTADDGSFGSDPLSTASSVSYSSPSRGPTGTTARSTLT
jgi:plastocyanin